MAGLVLIEKGELHGNQWDGGTLVGKDGRFRVELREGGQYGVHSYANGHFYHRKAVKVE